MKASHLLRLLAAGLLACGPAADRPPIHRAPHGATPAGSPATRWLTCEDSALASYLANERYGSSGEDATFGQCDTGGENDTRLIALAAYRVLRRDTTVIDSSSDITREPLRSVTYRLELTSAASFVPTWTLSSSSPLVAGAALSTPEPNKSPYVAQVGVRVDTVTLIVAHTLGQQPKWYACDLHHTGDQYTPFWDFISRMDSTISVVKWLPVNASWQGVAQLADSLTVHHRQMQER